MHMRDHTHIISKLFDKIVSDNISCYMHKNTNMRVSTSSQCICNMHNTFYSVLRKTVSDDISLYMHKNIHMRVYMFKKCICTRTHTILKIIDETMSDDISCQYMHNNIGKPTDIHGIILKIFDEMVSDDITCSCMQETMTCKVQPHHQRSTTCITKSFLKAIKGSPSKASFRKADGGHTKATYTLGKELGKGQFGITHLCTHKQTNRGTISMQNNCQEEISE